DRIPDRVVVLGDWIDERQMGWPRRRDVVVRAFTDAPAVVPAPASRRLVVHFFVRVLSDISDQHRAGPAQGRVVERELPRIADPDPPDLRKRRDWVGIGARVV